MMETILAAIALSLLIIIIARGRLYQRQIEALASDFSERIQEYQRKVVVLCTEPDSEEAQEIILHTRLTKVTDGLIEINKSE